MAGSKAVIVLAMRTDKPGAELYIYDGDKKIAEITWEAHQIEKILNKSSISYNDLDGITIYKGPGSFTGLRIGMSVANALAYAQNIPVIAATGADWLEKSIKDLQSGKNDKTALPEYGSPAHTTQQRK
jgi:tRNA threonylcarbamoyladenosine biosynthesis protein TsaB